MDTTYGSFIAAEHREVTAHFDIPWAKEDRSKQSFSRSKKPAMPSALEVERSLRSKSVTNSRI